MRPPENLVINSDAEHVKTAAADLATNWEIPEDVAHAALMLWLKNLTGELLAEAVYYSSAPTTSNFWTLARGETERLTAEQTEHTTVLHPAEDKADPILLEDHERRAMRSYVSPWLRADDNAISHRWSVAGYVYENCRALCGENTGIDEGVPELPDLGQHCAACAQRAAAVIAGTYAAYVRAVYPGYTNEIERAERLAAAALAASAEHTP